MGPDFEWDADIQDFISRRRAAAQKGGVVSHGLSKAETEACRYLSIDPALFRDMPRAQLVHCYRRAALREHPDTGGDHEAFVQIKEAYECLIRLKP